MQIEEQIRARANNGAFMANNGGGSPENAAAGQPQQPQQSINNPNPNRPRGGGGLLSRSGMFIGAKPTVQNNGNTPQARPGGLLSRTGKFPMTGANAIAPAPDIFTPNQNNNPGITPDNGNGLNTPYQNESARDWSPTAASAESANADYGQNMALAPARTTGTLQPSGTLKLNEPVKVVKVPVGNQPGQYITGILPFEKQANDDDVPATPRKPLKPWMGIALAVLVVVILLGSLGAFTLLRNRTSQTAASNTTTSTTTPGPQAQATAAADTNVLLNDPLDKEILSWPISPTNKYAFKDGAYHVTDTDTHGNGVVLAGRTYDNLTYTLTMQEIKGDDANTANTFGMIFRFNQQTQNGKTHTQFYSFEITNVTSGGDANYQLWHYDSNQQNQWIAVKDGKLAVGKEFHLGKAANTIKITMQNDTFTVYVNGQKLNKVFKDGTIKSGTIGMIVNNEGTEVAFKNLLLTKN
jgi:hypothetical protein